MSLRPAIALTRLWQHNHGQMDDVLELFFWVLMAVFTAGWIGCAITIPLVAFKFLMVPFEKDSEPAKDQSVE